MDRARGIYADHTKVRPIHFEGKYFKCRGPLNTVRSPQGRMAFVQAGGSPRGRAFAAKFADSIIATANGTEGMKAYRDDVRAHAVTFGRDPALQAQGLTRTVYTKPTLRETLTEF